MPEELDQPYYDVILCSDVLLPKLHPIEPLVKAIAALSGPNTITYVSYEHRHFNEFDPRKRFRDFCEENGLEVKTIPHSEYNPLYCVDDIEIWTVCQATYRSLLARLARPVLHRVRVQTIHLRYWRYPTCELQFHFE